MFQVIIFRNQNQLKTYNIQLQFILVNPKYWITLMHREIKKTFSMFLHKMLFDNNAIF